MRRYVIAVAILAALGVFVVLRPGEPSHRLRGANLSLRVPSSWSGYVRRPERTPAGTRGALLAAASFPLPRPDDDLGSAAMRRMHGGDVRIFIQDLTARGAPRWYRRQFRPLLGPLAVRSGDFGRFEGIPWSHSFAHRLFSLRGRDLEVTVDFVSPTARRADLAAVNRILATLAVDRSG